MQVLRVTGDRCSSMLWSASVDAEVFSSLDIKYLLLGSDSGLMTVMLAEIYLQTNAKPVIFVVPY